MTNVLVLCEGKSEQQFCNSVIGPHLISKGVQLAGTLVGKPHRKLGGIAKWPRYRAELLRLGTEQKTRNVGVLVDYYRMPTDWPGRSDAVGLSPSQRGRRVEDDLAADLASELGMRFFPCVQLHEFESLLFVDPLTTALSLAVAASGLSQNQLERRISEVRSSFGSVEEIDDSPLTAPSKRLETIVSGYDKVAWGVTAAKDVGLPTLRAGCPWLDRWLTKLEALGDSGSRASGA